MDTPRSTYALFPFGLLTVVVPLLAIHFCWVLSIHEGFLEPCIPYLEPCTSISRAGRHGSAYFWFKALMIPAAVLQWLFWCANGGWITSCGLTGARRLLVGGTLSSIALVIYSVSLGHEGDTFHALRRVGVVGYLGISFLLLLFLGDRLVGVKLLRRPAIRLRVMALLILSIGLASVVHGVVSPDNHDQWEDVYEWWLVLLLNLYMLGIVLLWRRSDLTLALLTAHGLKK